MRKTAIILVSILVIALLSGGLNAHKKISVAEAEKMIQSGKVLVVDVRTPEEYAKGHIPDAINIPLADIRSGKLDAVADKEQILLLYCLTGRRSEEAANLLDKHGYKNVYDFGGITDWTGAGFSIVTEVSFQ